MQKLIISGKENGVSRFYSQVSITAKPFFEYFGFIEVRKQQINIRDQILTNYLMENVI